jgi:uncharacterized membrane protein (Fun14 family)
MAWHEGKPEYRSSPNSKEVRENFAYLKALADLLSGAGVTEEELSQLHESGVVKADLVKLHGITSSATEINQLHESGVVKADLEKLHAITSTHTEINQLHESGVVKADLVKLHGITSSATEINQLHESGVVKADFEKLHDITVSATQINTCVIDKIKARAYRKAAQNIDAGPASITKILIDTISFDTEGVVNITNSRIVPNLPGYYIAIANIRVSSVPDGQLVIAVIVKNGAHVTHGTIGIQGAAGLSSSTASDLIYMNGTTDYLEMCVYNSHSSALTLYAGYSRHNYISILGPF